MFERRSGRSEQEEFWVDRSRIRQPKASGFYQRVEEHLRKMEFAQSVWAACEPAYRDEARGGRPGIDPVVYFKMLMVGFFENLGSERAIASRCEDSLAIRRFLGYELEEATPDHSSLSVIRGRLGTEVYQEVFEIILGALKANGLFKGRHLGIDSSVMEANASLRSLVHRNTEEAYWDYVRGLAAQAGIDPQNSEAVRRFDRKRPGRKTSNADWKNPHDEDARVGRTKDGACDMIYKPEHTTDLETGAIVAAEVLPGDHADTRGLTERVARAVEVVHEIAERPVLSLTADKGYFAIAEIASLQQEMELRTVIGDANAHRRNLANASAEHRRALRAAARAVRSKSGKALLRSRGQHIERSFEHVLDEGGLRRCHLRGVTNLTKRHKVAAACFNLSLLLRTLLGIGTAKQWIARIPDHLLPIHHVLRAICAVADRVAWLGLIRRATNSLLLTLSAFLLFPEIRRSSTVC